MQEEIDVWSGGDVKGSFGAATANLRGDALLTAAGEVSVAGEGSTVSLSGKLDTTAEDARLRTLGGATLSASSVSASLLSFRLLRLNSRFVTIADSGLRKS